MHISLSPIPYLQGMIKYMYARGEKLKEALLKLMLSLPEPGTLGVVYSVGIKIMWIGQ